LPPLSSRRGPGSAAQAACTPGRDSKEDDPTRLRTPPNLHPQPNSPASLDRRALDRAIATLLLGLDLVVVATGDQTGPTGSPASGGSVANGPTGYDPRVQQPNPAAAPTPPPQGLIADDAVAMRAALRGLLEDHGLPVIGEATDGRTGHQPAGRR